MVLLKCGARIVCVRERGRESAREGESGTEKEKETKRELPRCWAVLLKCGDVIGYVCA